MSNVNKFLDLSTAHVPGPSPDFGDLRTVPTEYGWVVFVSLDMDDAERSTLPDWFRPVWDEAKANECWLVNFDCDALASPNLREYRW